MKEFFRLVLPSEGYYAAWINPHDEEQKPRNIPLDSIDELEAFFQRGSTSSNDYIAVAAFKERDRRWITRKRSNVRAFKSLVMDVDFGQKGSRMREYPTDEAAAEAILNFLVRTELPKPIIVHSGWGYHLWFALDAELTPEEWMPLQYKLMNLAKHFGLEADSGVGITSQVLRPPGTINHRADEGEKEVTLWTDLDTYEPISVSAITRQLNRLNQEYKVVETPNAPFISHTREAGEPFPALIDTLALERECLQVQYAVTHQSEVSYLLWFYICGLAHYTTEPKQSAERWSKHHPNFSPAYMLEKMDEWSGGPPRCTTMQAQGFDDPETGRSLCLSCRHYQKVSTPAHVAVDYNPKTITTREVIEETQGELILPRGYRHSEAGTIFTDADGTDELVTEYNLWMENPFLADGIEYIPVKWHTLHATNPEVREAVVRTAYLNSSNQNDLSAALGDAGLNFTSLEEKRHVLMYLNQLKRTLERTRARGTGYVQTGWHNGNTEYVIGDTRYSLNEEGEVESQKILAKYGTTIAEALTPAGQLEPWVEATEIFQNAPLQVLGFVLCSAFGAPFVQFSGMGGSVVHLFGGTNAGKSTVQKFALSVYGNPMQLTLRDRDTRNFIFDHVRKLSGTFIGHDEVMNGTEAVQLSNLLYEVSHGKDRGRLKVDATAREQGRWAVVYNTNGNISMSSIERRQNAQEAELVRMVEIEANESLFIRQNKDLLTHVNQTIMQNYGLAIHAFIPHAFQALKEIGQENVVAFAKKLFADNIGYEFQARERYIETTTALSYFGAKIAEHAGLLRFNVDQVFTTLIDHLYNTRAFLQEAYMEDDEILSMFFSNNLRYTCVATYKQGEAIILKEPQDRVIIRVNLVPNNMDRTTIEVSQHALKNYLVHAGVNSVQFVKRLEEQKALLRRNVKKELGRGLDMPSGSSRCFIFDAGHSLLKGEENPVLKAV